MRQPLAPCQFKTLVDPKFEEEIAAEDDPTLLRKFRREIAQVCKERSAGKVTTEFRNLMIGVELTTKDAPGKIVREGGAYECRGEELFLSVFTGRYSCRLKNGPNCTMNKCNNDGKTTWAPNKSPNLSTLYAVEHIYDKKRHRPESGEEAEIITNSFANFVMANSGWNSGLGGVQNADFGKARREGRANNAEDEKDIVYRSDPDGPRQRNYFKAVYELLLW